MSRKAYNISKLDRFDVEALSRAEKLLDALLDDGVPPILRARIQRWFISDMSVNEKYSALKKLFMELQPNLEPDSYEYEQLRKICRVLGFDRRRGVPVRHVMMRAAAVVVSAFALAGIGWLVNDMRAPQLVVADVWVSTPEGATKRIVLPDGSQVWLNASSTIGYDDNFSAGRLVTLDGEAFFEVVRDTLSPFRVKAGAMVVEVLGTEFGVRRRDDGSLVEVVLASGSVRVAPTGREFFELKPSERMTFDARANEAVIEALAAEPEMEWRVADLRMTDMPLDAALRRIGSYYGLDVEVHGRSSYGDLVNLDLDSRMPLRQVLEVVRGISSDFNYEITDTQIIVTLK
jgi:ferric-dicitrate binding protein FerR (iron transport regulator)